MNGVSEKQNKLFGALQTIQLIVTIALAVITAKFSHDQDIFNQETTINQRKFAQKIADIETDLKIKQDGRAAEEANERLRFQIFVHVISVLDKKEKSEQQRLAGSSLVESLLDTEDILRIGLLRALTGDSKTPVGQRISGTVEKEIDFRAQEDASHAAAKEAASITMNTQGDPLSKYVVDVFTCEKDGNTFAKQAADILKYLNNKTAKSRPRVLYESVNASPGYRVSSLQLRYTPDEGSDAKALAKILMDGQKGEFSLHLVKKVTPNYMSVFLCS